MKVFRFPFRTPFRAAIRIPRRTSDVIVPLIISSFVDNLDQDPPEVSFHSNQPGVVVWDFHSSVTPPVLGGGDIATGELGINEGTNELEIDLAAYPGAEGYIHFRVYNETGVSNILTSQFIDVPVAPVLSNFVDDLDETPPVIWFDTDQAGTVYWDFHSSATPPDAGEGDIATGTFAAVIGANEFNVDLEAYETEVGYIHIRVINPYGESNVLTSQEIEVPVATVAPVTIADLFAGSEVGCAFDAQDADAMWGDHTATAGRSVADGTIGLFLDAAHGGLNASILLPNSDFSSGGTNWSPSAGCSVNYVAGTAEITNTGSNQGLYQDVTVPGGVPYIVEATLTSTGGLSVSFVGRTALAAGGANAFAMAGLIAGTKTQLITPSGGTALSVQFRNGAGTFIADGCAVYPLLGYYATQATAGSRPILRAGTLDYADFASGKSQSFTLPTNSDTDWTRAVQDTAGAWTFLENQAYTGAQTLDSTLIGADSFARIIFIDRALTADEKAGLAVAYPAP